MLFIILLATESSLQRRAKGRGRGSKWWNIVHAGQPTNLVVGNHYSNSIRTNDYPTINVPLRRKQRRLLHTNPGSLLAIAKGMKLAIAECKQQFRDRRWNCPTTDHMLGKSVFGKIVQRGCRETAFVYALTSAGVAHSVARACSEGIIETCTCDYRNRGPSGTDWDWGGCSDNMEFGYNFARMFVDAAERGRDPRFIMNLHNNEAGRVHVSTDMRRECKCHGMSGSCSVKTCWIRLPSFRDIGNNLKDRFDGASRVLVNNQGNYKRKYRFHLKPYNPNHKTPSVKDLVYIESSPDFCVPNLKLGVIGTKNRQCNDTSIGVDGCDLMCCGRGYKTDIREEFERCSCTFHWCCEVKCKICKIKKTLHVCL